MNAFRFLLLAGLLAMFAVPAQAQICIPPGCGEPILKPDGIIKFEPRPGLAGQTYPLTSVQDIADAMAYAVPLVIDAKRAGFMGLAYGIARDGELLTRVASEDLLLIPGPPQLIRPGVGPISGVFEGFQDPLVGFQDPLVGFQDPLVGYQDPLVGYQDPLVGVWGNGNIGFEAPYLGFDSPAAALDAIWGNGNLGFEAEYAFVLISYPLAGNQARLSGDAVVVPFDLVDGAALAPGNPPEAGALAGEAAVRVTAAPNPFRTVAALQYTLSEAAEVRLAVYDVLGREVAVLVDGPQEAGAHAAAFEAGTLPDGIYLYRLEAGRHVETGRLTLVR